MPMIPISSPSASYPQNTTPARISLSSSLELMYGSCHRSAGITPRYASAATFTIARIASRSSPRQGRMLLMSPSQSSNDRPREGLPANNTYLSGYSRARCQGHARRHHTDNDLLRSLPPIHRTRRGLPDLGRRRHRADRHAWQLQRDDSRPRSSKGGRSDQPTGCPRDGLRGGPPDRGGARDPPVRARAEPRPGALLQLRD